MKLYHGEKLENSEYVGEGFINQQIFTMISKYLEDAGYKSYYMRSQREGNVQTIDYGSHTTFFFIVH